MCIIGCIFAHKISICAMDKASSFNLLLEQAIIKACDKDALTDYKGATLQYHDVARKIEKLHIMFESSGVCKGDKIALCGRNSSSWACAFLAIVTYGAIAVPVQHEFKPEQVYNVVNHSESKLLFVGDVVSTTLDYNMMPNLEGVIYIPDYSLVVSNSEKLTFAREHLNEMFGRKYPKYFRKEHVKYHKRNACARNQNKNNRMVNKSCNFLCFSRGKSMINRRTAVKNNHSDAENYRADYVTYIMRSREQNSGCSRSENNSDKVRYRVCFVLFFSIIRQADIFQNHVDFSSV